MLNRNISYRIMSVAVILNRRTLLTSLGLILPAVAAEAADSKRKSAPRKPTAHHGAKVASHKPRRVKPATQAQS